MNGFGLNWIDNGDGTASCGGNLTTDPVTGESTGCDKHLNGDETVKESYNRDWNSDK